MILISTGSMLEMIFRYPGYHTYQHRQYVGGDIQVSRLPYLPAQRVCWRRCVCSDIQQHREHVGEGVYAVIFNSTKSMLEKVCMQ